MRASNSTPTVHGISALIQSLQLGMEVGCDRDGWVAIVTIGAATLGATHPPTALRATLAKNVDLGQGAE